MGLVTLANLVGTALGLVLTPILTETMPIPTVQLMYGGVGAVSALLFVIFAREKPAPPCPPGMEVRALMLARLARCCWSAGFWAQLLSPPFLTGNTNACVTRCWA